MSGGRWGRCASLGAGGLSGHARAAVLKVWPEDPCGCLQDPLGGVCEALPAFPSSAAVQADSPVWQPSECGRPRTGGPSSVKSQTLKKLQKCKLMPPLLTNFFF